MKLEYVIRYLSMQLDDDEAQLHAEPATLALITVTKLPTMLKNRNPTLALRVSQILDSASRSSS